jgi:hypothetical protein
VRVFPVRSGCSYGPKCHGHESTRPHVGAHHLRQLQVFRGRCHIHVATCARCSAGTPFCGSRFTQLRPVPGACGSEMSVTNRPFAACGPVAVIEPATLDVRPREGCQSVHCSG